MSFIPLDPGPEGGMAGAGLETLELIPAKKVALTEILPLTLVGGEVSLAVAPTNSALPLSPIFIKTSDGGPGQGFPGLGLDAASLLDNLDEITSLPHEFLNIGIVVRIGVKGK